MITSTAVKKAVSETEPKREKPKKESTPIVLDPETENSIVELTEVAKTTLFDFIKELEKAKDGTMNLDKLKELITLIEKLQKQHQDNKEYQDTIKEFLNRMKSRTSEFIKENPSTVKDEELKELLLSLFNNQPPISVDLSQIDVDKIVELYKNLRNAKESGKPSKETAARGRLISKLKKEQKNIEKAYKEIEDLTDIQEELSNENPSLENIRSILNKEENKSLNHYFEEYINDLESFKNKFEIVMEDKYIQRIIYLSELLSKQLKEHKNQLNTRFNKEFLERRSKLSSIFTELPNAVSLSIRKLINSIDELKKAKNQRKKMYSTKEVVKEVATVIGTPVLFTGKYLVSNWYTLYMAFEGIMQSREQARREKEAKEAEERAKRAAEEERLRKEEEERKQAEEEEKLRKTKEEIARKKEELREKREEEERLRREEDERIRREMEAKMRREEEEARRQAEEAKKAEEKAAEEVPEPIPETSKYEHLKGTRIKSFADPLLNYLDVYPYLPSEPFGSPDTIVRVCYSPADAKSYEIWKDKTENFTIREIQEIWNFWPDIDLDEYFAEHSKSK